MPPVPPAPPVPPLLPVPPLPPSPDTPLPTTVATGPTSVPLDVPAVPPPDLAKGRAARGPDGLVGEVISVRYIFSFWLPLASMWLMMSLEQPIIAGVIARLPDPERNLAAFGLTFSLALIVESPVIMLLTAGTALATHRQPYRLLVAFTTILAVVFTLLHLVIGLTPAYGWIVGRLVGAPAAVVEPGRQAFLFMVAWTGAIAYRRLWQGVMIRFGRTGRVGATTTLRLAVTALVCVVGLRTGLLSGASVGALALSMGVITGAIAAYVLARSTIQEHLLVDDPTRGTLGVGELLGFYGPLALTSLIVLGGQPLVSFGLGRAPDALRALAAWPVVMGLLFIVRSGAYAYQEVVVALVDRPGAYAALRRFTITLAVVLTGALLLVALTPLAEGWLERVAGLSPELVRVARPALVLVTPIPGLSVLVSWFRGLLVHAGRTPVITQAVAVNLTVLGLTLFVGLAMAGRGIGGVNLAATALTLSLVSENLWLYTHRATTLQPANTITDTAAAAGPAVSQLSAAPTGHPDRPARS